MGPEVIAALIGAVVTIGATIFNATQQKSINDQNQSNLEESWNRDDSQLQRQRVDAEKAGFSPLAALGYSAGNTNPMTLEAPQVDAQSMGSSVSSIGSAYKSYKERQLADRQVNAQMAYMHEQQRGLKLDNDLKESDAENLKIRSSLETAKLVKELAGMDLNAGEKASILKANGFTDSQISKLVGFEIDVPEHTGEVASEALTTAQKDLASAQKFDIYNQSTARKELAEAQKRLANVQANIQEGDYKFWYEPLPNDDDTMKKYTLKYPYYDYESETVKYDYIGARGKSRKELYDEFSAKVSNFNTQMAQLAEDDRKWQRVKDKWMIAIDTINAVTGVFKR